MSTKGSIYYSDAQHIYTECFDDDPLNPVYLDQATGVGNITITLSVEAVAAMLVHHVAAVQHIRKWASKTDQDLDEFVRDGVATRMKYKGSDPGTGGAFLASAGWAFYGSPDRPEEDQIADGLREAKHWRGKCKDAIAALDAEIERSRQAR